MEQNLRICFISNYYTFWLIVWTIELFHSIGQEQTIASFSFLFKQCKYITIVLYIIFLHDVNMCHDYGIQKVL